MFGGLDWPLNASRGFVSISWASCFYIFWTLLITGRVTRNKFRRPKRVNITAINFNMIISVRQKGVLSQPLGVKRTALFKGDGRPAEANASITASLTWVWHDNRVERGKVPMSGPSHNHMAAATVSSAQPLSTTWVADKFHEQISSSWWWRSELAAGVADNRRLWIHTSRGAGS